MSRQLKVDEAEITALLVKLVKAKSENPPGFEKEAAIVVKDYLNYHGLDCRLYEKKKGRTNVLCDIGSGKPNLALICHLDVVPAGSGWSRPPYDGVIEGGRLYGRGASDNKGALASVLVAASRVKDEIEKSNLGKLTIAAVADEEQGNTYGMHYLIEEAGFKPDYAIVCEPTGCTSVVVAEKGILRVKLRSKGRLAHGSRPQEGINAITKLSKVLVKLEEFTMSYEPHPLFSPPTLNVGVIVGGEAVNVVPSECTCLLDIRYLPGQEPGHILSEIEELIATVKRMDPQVDIDVEMVGAESPIVTSQDHPLIKLISESSLNVAGFSPKITGIGGGTVAKVLVKKGISSVVYGPGEESVCHRADEYVDVSQLKLASQIYGIVMLNFKGYLEAHRRV